MKYFLPSVLSLCVSLLAFSTSAKADTVQFTLTSGANTVSFTLPSSPTPFAVNTDCPSSFPGEFCLDSVPVTFNGSTISDQIEFFNASGGGGINFLFTGGAGLDQIGYQLYSGTESAPTFVLGSYPLSNAGDGIPGDYTLQIAQAGGGTDPGTPNPVPEPSSLLLLGSGALGVATAVRRRVA